MYCKRCGNPLPEGSQFCGYCGYRMELHSGADTASGKKRILLAVLVGILSCACILTVFFLLWQKSPGDSSPGNPAVVSTKTTEPSTSEAQPLPYWDSMAAAVYADTIVNAENLIKFYLFDLDGDNIRELILRTGISEADTFYQFYTFRNGALQYLDSLSGGHSDLFISDGALIKQYGHMGYETVEILSMGQSGLVTTCILDRTVPADGDYTAYSECPIQSTLEDLSPLAQLYVASGGVTPEQTAYFVETDGFFTNGQQTCTLLADGRLFLSDGTTGTVDASLQFDTETMSLLAVTDHRLYFIYDDPEDWWGIEVISCTYTGGNTQTEMSGCEAVYDSGYLVLKSFRTDISPHRLIVIDSHDTVLVSGATAWDAAVYRGAVYYLAVDGETWYTTPTHKMQLCRMDSSGTTVVAEYQVSACAYIDSGVLYLISQGTAGGENGEFDLQTGKRIS